MTADVIIIGGGISGLTVAYYLVQSGLSVILLEKESHLGGLATCLKQSGFFIEKLYHHFFKHDMEALRLLQELHLLEKVYWEDTSTGLYVQGGWYNLSTPFDLMKLTPLHFIERIQFGYYLLSSKYMRDLNSLDALSVKDWFKLNLSKTFYPIINQLLYAKFGVGVQEVSAAFLCGRFKARTARRSIFQKRERLGYLQGSLHQMITALAKLIERAGGQIMLQSGVTSIEQVQRGYQVRVNGNEVIDATVILSTMPPQNFAALAAFLPQAIRDQFQPIEYMGVVCTIISVRQSLIPYYWGTIADPNLPFTVLIEHTQLVKSDDYHGECLLYAAHYLPVHTCHTFDIHQWEQQLVAALPQVAYDGKMPQINWMKTNVFPYATPIYRSHFGQRRAALPVIEGVWMTGPTFTYPESRNVNSMIRNAAQQARNMLTWFRSTGRTFSAASPLYRGNKL